MLSSRPLPSRVTSTSNSNQIRLTHTMPKNCENNIQKLKSFIVNNVNTQHKHQRQSDLDVLPSNFYKTEPKPSAALKMMTDSIKLATSSSKITKSRNSTKRTVIAGPRRGRTFNLDNPAFEESKEFANLVVETSTLSPFLIKIMKKYGKYRYPQNWLESSREAN